MGKRKVSDEKLKKEPSRKERKYTINNQTTKNELVQIRRTVNNAIKSMGTTKPSDKDTINQLPNIASQILKIYDKSENKAVLTAILDDIANYMIKSNDGEELEDLNDLNKRLKGKMKILYGIHARTLFEGNKPIPKNLSVGYLEEILSTRREAGLFTETNALYDVEVLKFVENLSKDFRVENKETYLEIVNEMIYKPLVQNPEMLKDERINQSKSVLTALVDYVRTYKDVSDEKGENHDYDLAKVIVLIKSNFNDLMEKISPNYWETLSKKLEDCFDGFAFAMPSKDITQYSSFAEFIDDINTQQINTVAPLSHVPVPRIVINQRPSTKGMSDDDKFKAIQELVKKQRGSSPDLIIPTILVGYKAPFEGYIVFPFERQSVFDKTPRDNEDDRTYNLVISDTFGTSKGGSFRTMTRSNIPVVLGSDRNAQGPAVQGVAMRKDSYNIPGVIAVDHRRDNGFGYYVEMIDEAVNELKDNPTACFGKSLKVKISELNGKAPVNNTVYKTAAPKAPQVPQVPAQAPSTPIVQPRVIVNGNPTDKNGYDKLGINLEKVYRSAPIKSSNAPRQEMARNIMIKDLKDQYGYGRNPGLDLLDYCLEEMLISGKNMVEIVQDLAEREEYKSISGPTKAEKDLAFNRMYSYVKNMIIVAVDNDPDYPNEKMKEIYEKAIIDLDTQGLSLDSEIAAKKVKRDDLVKNTKKALEYFNTSYEK